MLCAFEPLPEAAAEGPKAASMRLTLEMLEMDQRAGQKDWFPRS